MTREELTELLWIAARNGSVSAMQTLLDELRRDGRDSVGSGFIDELAKRRLEIS